MSTSTIFLLLMEIHLPNEVKNIIWKERILILKTLFWIWINSVYKISTCTYTMWKKEMCCKWFTDTPVHSYVNCILQKSFYNQMPDFCIILNFFPLNQTFVSYFINLGSSNYCFRFAYNGTHLKLELPCTSQQYSLDNYNHQALATYCFSLSQKTPQ